MRSAASQRSLVGFVGPAACPMVRSAALCGRAALALHPSLPLQQRTPSSRLRNPTWQEKKAMHEAVAERARQQQEAEERASRNARRRSGSSSTTPPTRKSWLGRQEEQMSVDRDTVPRLSLLRFFARPKEQPINPLHDLRTLKAGAPQPTPLDRAQHDPSKRATLRLLSAIQQLQGKSRRRDAKTTIQLTEEQQLEVANQFAASRWYGKLYHPFRHITAFQVKVAYRSSMAVMVLLSAVGVALMCFLYYQEMSGLLELSPQDRQDYAYMVRGMRYSDIYKLVAEVQAREDPLRALPPAAVLHLMLEEARARGWHTADWEVELRKTHPLTPLEELDWVHLSYWAVMTVGTLWSGGGSLFEEDFTDLMKSKVARQREMANADTFAEEGPKAKEDVPKRSFFSW